MKSAPETVGPPTSPPAAAVKGIEFLELFVTLCRVLSFDALRLKPREKQLALILGLDSFANGLGFGVMDVAGWRLRLSSWRSNELKAMLAAWCGAGWLAVDATEQTFRLALDRLPGWADAQNLMLSEQRPGALGLTTEADLPKTLAEFSQDSAKISQLTKISQNAAKISQGGLGGLSETLTFSQTFNRFPQKRINVKRSERSVPARSYENFATCENFAKPTEVSELMEAVRAFVGEADWADPKMWNYGAGYRRDIFTQEAGELTAALRYCVNGLRTGELRVKKTPGAMLWDQFRRTRNAPQK